MKKIFKLLLLIVITFFIVIFIINAFKLKGYKDELLARAEEIFNVKIIINGPVKFGFFGITLKDIKIIQSGEYDDDIYYDIKKVDINFSPISLPFTRLKVDSITFADSEINEIQFLSEVSNVKRKIILENIRIKNEKFLIDFHIKSASYIFSGNELKITGEILGRNNENYDFNTNSKNGLKHIQLFSKNSNIKIISAEGKYKLQGNGKNLAQVINDFTAIDKSSSNDEQFQLDFEIDNFFNDEFSMKGDVKSDLLNLSVETVEMNGYKKLQIASNMVNLDLLDIRSIANIDFSQYFNFVIPEKVNLNIVLNLDAVSMKGKLITGFSLDANLKNSRMNINKIEAKLPGDVSFSSSGEIVKNGFFSQLDGRFDLLGSLSEEFLSWVGFNEDILSSKDFSFGSKFIFAPQMIIFYDQFFDSSDLKVNVPLINYKKISNKRKLRGEAEISNLNLEGKIVKYFWNYCNNVNPDIDFIINLNNSKINNSVIENINFDLHSSNREYQSTISVVSKNNMFEGNVFFDEISKNLRVDINGDSFNADILKFPSVFNINDDGKKAEIKWNLNKIENPSSSVNIKFDCNVKNLFRNDINFGKLLTNFTLDENILTIDRFELGKDEKSFNLVSSIAFDEVSNNMKLSFTGKNLEIHKLLRDLFEINYVSGYLNVAGALDSYGGNMAEIINNLSGSISIVASELNVDGVDFNILPEEIQNTRLKNQLDTLTRIKVFKNQTNFESISGSTNIGNGIAATSLKFLTGATSGIISSNLDLNGMNTNSIVKILFVAPNWMNQTVDVDMQIEGSIWYPKLFFDNNKIYDMIIAKNNKFKNAA